MKRRFSFMLATFIAAGAVSCGKAEERPLDPPSEARPRSLGALLRYPPARWRLASPILLDSVVLEVSHILIRHAGLHSQQAAFSAADWSVSYPQTTRSEQEALELARQLEARIRGGEPFETVARQFSEDPLTAARGGSLGTRSAGQFGLWPDVLDLLDQTPIGEVSRPLLTDAGFHLFLRRPLPSAKLVSGRRLVIGHSGAPWLEFNARGQRVSRTREQALAIAQSLQRELAAHPEDFEAKVRELSEHLEAERGGDIGEWSTLEPSVAARELQVLGELEIGQVSPPVEGLFGIELLQRTASRPRQTYGASLLRLPSGATSAADDPGAVQRALENAQALARQIAKDALAFAHEQQERCCPGVERVVEGRAWTPLELELRRLQPGEVGGVPIRGDAGQLWIVKRELEAPPAPTFRFALPRPAQPDISWFTAEDGSLAAQAMKRVNARLSELALPQDLQAKVLLELGSLEYLEDVPQLQRLDKLDESFGRVRSLLAEPVYAQLLGLVDSEFERLLLAPF